MADAAPAAAPETVRVYDDAGQGLDLPQAEAEAALRSGKVGLKADQTVFMRGEDGQIAPVTGAEAAKRLTSFQNSLAGEGAFTEQQTAAEYGGALQGARAAAAGGLSALTFGASDQAFAALGGDELRQDLGNLRKYRPGLTTLGEVGGMLLPAFVSGGSSAGLRALTAAPRALTAGAGLAERAAARGLMAAGAAEGGVIARAVPMALGQALEMGAYSAGQEVSRAALANENLSGERLFNAFGHGALFGAGAGGVLGAAGAVGARAIGAAREGAVVLGERAVGRAGELLDRGIEMAGGLEGFAAQKAIQSTSATPTMLKNLERAPGATKANVVRQMEEDLPMLLGKEKGAILSRPQMAEAAEKNVDAWGQKIGDSLNSLDAAGTKIRPDVAAIVKEAREGVVKELKSSPFSAEQGAQLEKLVNDIETGIKDPSFSELHRQRQLLDRRIRFEAQNPSIGQESLRDLRGILEREIERSAEAASKELGADFGATYKAAKEQYGAAKWLEEATAHGAAKEGTAMSMGFREMVGAIGGSNLGSTVGGMVAGPVGAAVGGAVGGVASAYVNNLVKRYGDQTVASAARRLGRGASPAQIAAAVMDEVVGKSVAGYLRGGVSRAADAGKKALDAGGEVARGAVTAGAKAARGLAAEGVRVGERHEQDRADEYRKARAAVAAAATQNDRAQRLNQALPPGTTPKMAEAAQKTADRAINFLQSKMPPEPARGQTLTPQAASRLSLPSPTEQQRFLAAFRAAADPASVLESMARGELNGDAVETVRALYPEEFSSWQEHVQAALSTRQEELPYEKAAELSRLFGIVGHPSYDPAFIARQQVTFRAAAPPPAPSPGRAAVPVAHLFDPDTKEATP